MKIGSLLNIIIAICLVLAVGGVIYLNNNLNLLKTQDPNTPGGTTVNAPSIKEPAFISAKVSTDSAKVGDKISSVITVDTPKTPKNGAHVIIKFNPNVLQVIDQSPPTPGVQIALTKDLNQYENIIRNEADNQKGIIDIDLQTSDPNKIVEDGYFATINFKVIGKGKSGIVFDQRATNIYFVYKEDSADIQYNDVVITVD